MILKYSYLTPLRLFISTTDSEPFEQDHFASLQTLLFSKGLRWCGSGMTVVEGYRAFIVDETQRIIEKASSYDISDILRNYPISTISFIDLYDHINAHYKPMAKKEKSKYKFLMNFMQHDTLVKIRDIGNKAGADRRRVTLEYKPAIDKAKIGSLITSYLGIEPNTLQINGDIVTEAGAVRGLKIGKWVTRLKDVGSDNKKYFLEQYSKLLKQQITGRLIFSNKVCDCLTASDVEEGSFGSCQSWLSESSRSLANQIYFMDGRHYVASIENEKGLKLWRAWITEATHRTTENKIARAWILGRSYPGGLINNTGDILASFRDNVLKRPELQVVPTPGFIINMETRQTSELIPCPHPDIETGIAGNILLEVPTISRPERPYTYKNIFTVTFDNKKHVCVKCGEVKTNAREMNCISSCVACNGSREKSSKIEYSCQICGKHFVNEPEKVQACLVCPDCYERKTIKCDCCGRVEFVSVAKTFEVDGLPVAFCHRCFSEQYKICGYCGEIKKKQAACHCKGAEQARRNEEEYRQAIERVCIPTGRANV